MPLANSAPLWILVAALSAAGCVGCQRPDGPALRGTHPASTPAALPATGPAARAAADQPGPPGSSGKSPVATDPSRGTAHDIAPAGPVYKPGASTREAVAGEGSGGASDDAVPFDPFCPPGGFGIGLKGPLFGNDGNARRVVFVCDATGTMISKMATLKEQLAKGVDGLKPVQSFNIIFFTDGPKAASPDTKPLVATAENKRRALKWLDDVLPFGQADPTAAIDLAFKQDPQLVYFLSDGEFNGLKSYKEIEEQFAKLNPEKKVKVNTILFETFDKEAEEVMERIARTSGGKYTFVREADLNR